MNNGIYNDEQLDAIFKSLAGVQQEILPQGANLIVVIDQLENVVDKDDERGIKGLVRCLGEQAGQAVINILEEFRLAFPVLRYRLLLVSHAKEAATAPNFTAMLASMAEATATARSELENVLAQGAFTPEQVAEIRKEIDRLSEDVPMPSAKDVPEMNMSHEEAIKVRDLAEAEAMKELEKLIIAANLDPKEIMANLPKADDFPPEPDKGQAPATDGKRAPQPEPSEAELKAQLDKAEQEARSHLPNLEQQLIDAGFDVSEIRAFFSSM